MSNPYYNLQLKEAMVFRGFFSLLCLVAFQGFFSSSFAQDATIQHSQKKASFNNVMLPGDSYVHDDFYILVPDSIYNKGSLTVKKAEINNIKPQCVLVFSDNKYTSCTYDIKPKNVEAFESMVCEKLGIAELADICKSDNLSLTTTKNIGSRTKFIFVAK